MSKKRVFGLVEHLERQREFSLKAFGPGACVSRVLGHMALEVYEVRANPSRVDGWVDIMLLGFDGAWRAGYDPRYITEVLKDQCSTNMVSRDGVGLDVPLLVSWLEALRVEDLETLGDRFTSVFFLSYLERASLGKSALDDRLCITWVNRVLWAASGAMAEGISAGEIVAALEKKQAINESCDWPDWRKAPAGKPIEHSKVSA